MPFAVEMYVDAATERTVRSMRQALRERGIRPIVDELGDRPHISLAVFPTVEPPPILEQTEQFARHVKPFPLCFAAIGMFPASGVLFLSPTISEALFTTHLRYHKLLHSLKVASHAYYRPGNWTPHCTIAQNVAPELSAKAFEVLRSAFTPMDARIVEVGLVEYRPVKPVQTFALGGNHSLSLRDRAGVRGALDDACVAMDNAPSP